jgi:lipoate-protein ligase B
MGLEASVMPDTLATLPVAVRWLGRMPYAEAWAMQKALLAPIADGEHPETLLLVEHEPVITLGRKAGAAANVRDAGEFPVFTVERGGDATYHGPGQLVGYPLFKLREGEQDLHRYLRNMEEVLIRALADFGLAGGRSEGLTGVWVQDRKVASLGVAVRRWVTYHGFALNVAPNMAHLGRLNPCGLSGDTYASMASLLGRSVAVEDVARQVVAHLPSVLHRQGQLEL